MNPTPVVRKRRAAGVVKIAVELIIFATLGVTALTLLFSATTTNWGSTVPTIAITVTAILAALAVALGFFGKHSGSL
jgi:hypothetical protein